eukprot:CAMPEP_0198289756 /NCGR_PEP_ID=MMETSP1449-20131203/7836_1 /TAXON_ID=420275 /ORGANISM="Attheya septentrionalis, Strain CCMP2084" /LENGTH=333 /DNA_ID=CAMNT_0043988143 /DNA_START=301 /DNA_END=1302 /DNA_ORIENTATION=+
MDLRRDDQLVLEVVLCRYALSSEQPIITMECDSEESDHDMKDDGDNDSFVPSEFHSSMESITVDDLGTIFETEHCEDSDTSSGKRSKNSPVTSQKVCNDKLLKSTSLVNTFEGKTEGVSGDANFEISRKLGPLLEARRPKHGRRFSGSSRSSEDIDSSQSSARTSHSALSEQSFVLDRNRAGRKSKSSSDLFNSRKTSKLPPNRRQMIRRSFSFPGSCTQNETWAYIDSSKSVAESSPYIEKLRKKSYKTKSSYTASRTIQETNEVEAMAAAIAAAKRKITDENATKNEQETHRKSLSYRISRPVVSIDEPDDDGHFDDLTVLLGRSMELDLS